MIWGLLDGVVEGRLWDLWTVRTVVTSDDTGERGVAGSRTIIRVNSISIMQIEFGLQSGGGTEVDVSIGRFPPAVL